MSGRLASPRGVIRTTLLGGVLAVGTVTVAAGADADPSAPTATTPGRDEVIEAVFAGVEPALVPFRYACESWHFRAIDLLEGDLRRVGGSDCEAGPFAGEEPGSAAPTGPACDGTVATSGVAWGDTIARLEACRDGWGASYDVTIEGPLADEEGRCLAARVELGVVSAAGEIVPAATDRIPIDCREPAPSRGWSGRLAPPAVGVGIGAVGLALCDVDGDCRVATVQLPQSPTRADAERLAEMDEIMSMPLDAFIELKARSVDDDAYTWADDGCSIPSAIPGAALLDIPLLEDACRRHDWGYRNFGSVKGWDRTDDRRSSVDDRLLADAETSCAARLDRPGLVDACFATARTVVGLVRTFGARAFYGA